MCSCRVRESRTSGANKGLGRIGLQDEVSLKSVRSFSRSERSDSLEMKPVFVDREPRDPPYVGVPQFRVKACIESLFLLKPVAI